MPTLKQLALSMFAVWVCMGWMIAPAMLVVHLGLDMGLAVPLGWGVYCVSLVVGLWLIAVNDPIERFLD